MPPKKARAAPSPSKGMPRIRAFRKYAEPYRPTIEQDDEADVEDGDDAEATVPTKKTAAKPPPAKKAKKPTKAEIAAEKAAEKAEKAAQKTAAKPAPKPTEKPAEKTKPVEKTSKKVVLTKSKKPATTKQPAPKPPKTPPPPPPCSDDDTDDDGNDEYDSPGPQDELDYMAEENGDEEVVDPDDAVEAILQEESAEPPIKAGRKKRSPNIYFTPKQQADIVEFVKSHPNLYDRSDTQFFLTPVRDRTWEECAAKLQLNGKYN